MNIKDQQMDVEKIRRLLERYYEAQCSEEEELFLRKFFADEDVPSTLADEREIFRYYASYKVPDPEVGFEERILSSVDIAGDSSSLHTGRRAIITLLSAAAGVALLAGTWFIFMNESEPQDTFTDPELAYAETIKILYSISTDLNYGKTALEPLGEMNEITRGTLNTINGQVESVGKKLKTLNLLRETAGIINEEIIEKKK